MNGRTIKFLTFLKVNPKRFVW